MPTRLCSLRQAGHSARSWWMLAAVIAIELLVAAVVGMTLVDERAQVEERAAQATRNDALALERELAAIVRSCDIVLGTVIDEYHRELASGGIEAVRLNQFIAAQAARLPEAEGVRVTDAAGTIRYGSDVAAGARVDVSDRPPFRSLAAQEQDGLVISRPQRTRTDQRWQVMLARGAKNPDGSFAGMAFVSVPVENLTQTLAQIAVPEAGAITLRGADLGIIARYPDPDDGDDVVGQSVVAKPLTDLFKTGADAGTFRATTPLDRIERLTSFRKVAGYPLYLTVGRAEGEYLRSWKKSATITAGAIALFAAMATTLALVAHRTRRHLAQAKLEIRRLAHTDFVSELMNRRALLESAELELARARRYGKALSLLVLDIDHFKSINDTLGHYAGDKALQQFATRVRHALREVDLLGRWSAGEFVAVLPETDVARAREVAERVRQMVAATELTLDGAPRLKLTVSIGIATLAASDEAFDTIIARADAALQDAKNAGRNRVCG
ncbi:MAG TPA: sensor domain-containing diguanylate cyclase [Aromatoleum sp.]|uniref:GGDEF domain-containing protein n=1 Tax=Aromatoleum sp. TaxID=2307007 RepID=UPI002B49247B|nr:sensor domain-containing diguanylate cyclase [Aromatoleum sp.]HJV26259.1 sensor domain-containing diguanylate cyclase [Aromatoleum sp.]